MDRESVLNLPMYFNELHLSLTSWTVPLNLPVEVELYCNKSRFIFILYFFFL